MNWIRLKPSEKKSAAKVFGRAFFNYPMITFIRPDPQRRERYFEWYWECAVNYGLRYGEVYTTPGMAGVAMWLPPGQTYITNWRYIKSGYLFLPLAMGIKTFTTRAIVNEDQVSKAHKENMPGPHWYLWIIAVDPDQQGKGIGSILMQPGLESADAQNLPCYVETHDEKNIPFYQKHSFELISTEQIPGFDLRFWCFKREPFKV